MNLKRLCLLTGLLFAGVASWSQHQNRPATFAVTLGPALLPLSNVELGLQSGVQYVGKKWGVNADYTIPLHKPSDNFAAVHYTRLGLQAKRYLKPENGVSLYVSLQSTYALRNFTDTNGGRFFRRDAYDRFTYSKARIRSPIFTLSANVGVEVLLGKRFLLDVALGVGVRAIYTEYTQVENELPQDQALFGHVGPISAYRYDKTVTRLHLAPGFRAGYILKQ